jgi:hypothetical protein
MLPAGWVMAVGRTNPRSMFGSPAVAVAPGEAATVVRSSAWAALAAAKTRRRAAERSWMRMGVLF